jgi:hypothetical protein
VRIGYNSIPLAIRNNGMSGKKQNKKIKNDLRNYTRSEPRFEDGEWWYIRPSGVRERVKSHAKKNLTRMFVNGRYIPKSHPLHKPGRYKSLDDAWSHEEIEKTSEGYVYAIVNPAWPEWIKVGKAVSADDRLLGYQTSSPHRDYKIVATMTSDDRHEQEKVIHRVFANKCLQRKGEWFKLAEQSAIDIFERQGTKDE